MQSWELNVLRSLYNFTCGNVAGDDAVQLRGAQRGAGARQLRRPPPQLPRPPAAPQGRGRGLLRPAPRLPRPPGVRGRGRGGRALHGQVPQLLEVSKFPSAVTSVQVNP